MQQNVSSPPKKDLVSVKTVFGSSAIPKNNSVYVQLPDGRFMRQPVSTIKPGQQLLFRKDEIPGITLEEVGEALIKSPRYVGSIQNLFVKFGDESLPLFQQALLSGIWERAEAWPSQITSDTTITALFALGHPIRLSDMQRTVAADFIHTTLVERGASQPVTVGHIEYNWLEGNVVAPRNRKDVVGALSEIAPGLTSILSEQFTHAYHAYISIRQSVMRAITGILHGEKLPEQLGGALPQTGGAIAEPGKEKFSVAPEINLVIKHFASDISAHYLTATVVEVKDGKNGTETAPAEEKRTHEKKPPQEKPLSLFKGIVTDRLATEEIRVKPLRETALETNLMGGVTLRLTSKLLDDYEPQIFSQIKAKALTERGLYLNFLMHVHSQLPKTLGFQVHSQKKTYDRMKELCPSLSADYQQPEKEHQLTVALTETLSAHIIDGSADMKYGLPKGTLFSVFELFANLKIALPNDVYAAKTFKDIIKNKMQLQESRLPNQPAVSYKNEQRAYDVLTKSKEMREAAEAYAMNGTRKEMRDCIRSLMPELGANVERLESLTYYSGLETL